MSPRFAITNLDDLYEQVEPALLRDDLDDAMQWIPQREALILRWRFGLDDDRKITLRECAERLQISKERVRQLESEGLRHLRRSSHVRSLLREY